MVSLAFKILSVVYIVTRVFEKKLVKKNKVTKNNLKNNWNTSGIVDVRAKEKRIDHHLKVSTLGIATTLIGNVYYPAKLMSLGVISYSIVPILRETEKSLLVEKKVKNDLINSIVSLVCIGTGQYFSTALVAGLYYIGDKMVIKTQDRSKAMVNDLFQLPSNQVVLLTHENEEIEMAIENTQVNDILVVNAGNIVPVDGQVIEGTAMIDQHALTGESALVEKKIGDHLLATTLVISGKIFVRIEHTGIETSAAKIRDILKQTTEYKTSLQSRGEQWADKVALPLMGATGLLVPIIGILPATALLYTNPGNSIKTFISLQTVNYLIFLSKQGILIKDGRALEELFKVDTVLFDNTDALQFKPEIKAMLDHLRRHQVKHIGLISSEHKQPTQKLAQALAMDSYFYEVLPSDKVKIIKKLQQQKKTVCFVGNGIHNGPAMKQANVSISFSDASTITTDSAQIILMDGNLSHLPALLISAQSLSIDTKRILSLLGTTTGIVIMGTVFSKMRIIGAVGLEIVENVTGFGYVMRPLKDKQAMAKSNSRQLH
jgi:cation transport ATPase